MLLFLSYSSLQRIDSKLLALSKLVELHDHIMNISASELYHSDVTQLVITIFRKNGYDKEAETLEERLLDVVLELRAQPQEGTVSMERAYKFAQHLFDSKNYQKVIDVGTYIMESLDRETPNDVHLNIKVELLIGRARFHGGNYSEGLDEIESTLVKILNHSGTRFVEEKMISCFYLIPRARYINACYDVEGKIKTVILGTIYLLFQLTIRFSPTYFQRTELVFFVQRTTITTIRS